MTPLIAPQLERYAHDHASEEPPLLVELREETHRELADPQMQVGRIEGALLKLLVQLSGARRVLEIGTFSGYSALSMAAGLPPRGKLITCDRDPQATAMARRYFARSEMADKIELREGEALSTVQTLASEGETFDVAFLDADKGNYVRYWDAIVPMMHIGGLIIADNTLWSGTVLDPQTDDAHAIVAFNQHVRNDPRVDDVLLTVRDGITLARKHRH